MKTFANPMKKVYSAFARSANSLQSMFLWLVRLYWGWQFAQVGWGKLHNLPHVIQFFTSLGIPAPAANAYFISILELVGGILLALGLGARLIALPLAIDMMVAYLTADRQALASIFSDPGKFYAADPFTFLMASLIILIFGSGLFSVDWLIERRWLRSPSIQETAPSKLVEQ
jgi:putative oxidoreductase